jgi:2-polyprenyl-3-methyl-5-hydroxy-6-metoxy-1,4-benzoquinol methylase
MEELSNCPVCHERKFEFYLKCRDHSISKQEFTLQQCTSCDFVFTNPRPRFEEIGPYYSSEAYISHHANKRGLIPVIYRQIRKIQFGNKSKLIRQLAGENPTILDIGSGSGDFIKYCTTLGLKATGVEPDKNTRETSVLGGQEVYDLNFLDETKEKFSVITMWHVLEHVHALEERMLQLKKLIKPDGIIIIAVPNLESYDAGYYNSFWAAYDVPRHLYHFSRKTITKLFTRSSFNLLEVVPMKYDSYYVSIKSEEYKNGKLWSYLKGPLIGLLSNRAAFKTGEYSSQIYVFKP